MRELRVRAHEFSSWMSRRRDGSLRIRLGIIILGMHAWHLLSPPQLLSAP